MPSCFCPDWKMSAYPYKHFFAILKFRSHMWRQQLCHIWGETLYSNSSQLETLTIAAKNFILNVAGFLGPPLFINIAVLKFFQKNYHWLLSKFQSNVSLFTINIHVIPKIVQTAWLHEKLQLKNGEIETKNSIYSFTSLDGPSRCYFATKLQENLFSQRSFCFDFKWLFVNPEYLYFQWLLSKIKTLFL